MSGCQESPMCEDVPTANPIILTEEEKKQRKKEYNKWWWANNKDKARAYCKKRYYENPKRAYERNAKYRREHPLCRVGNKTYNTERKEYRAQWARDNPEKMAFNAHRRRAQKRKTRIEIFYSGEIYQRDKWICQICKEWVDKSLKWPDLLSPSLDHIIPLVKGGPHTQKTTYSLLT